jgi:two-component system, NtrC family, nitrogen regulation sensor histidine kinase NtrY
LLLLAISAQYVFLNFFETANKKEIANRISKSLKKETDATLKKIDKISTAIFSPDSLYFTQFLNETSDFNIIVYKNQKLIYWSENKFIPDYNRAKFSENLTLFSNKSGKKLFLKKDFSKNENNYLIVAAINLESEFEVKNKYLNSGLNSAIFPTQNLKIENNKKDNYTDIKINDKYLFSIVFDIWVQKLSIFAKIILTCLYSSAILLFLWFLYLYSEILRKKEKPFFAILTIASGLFLCRFLMIYFGFPYFIFPNFIFNPVFFASSVISPSVGDLAINILFSYLLLLYLHFLFPFSVFSPQNPEKKKLKRYLLAVFVLLLYSGGLYLFFDQIKSVVYNSNINFDIINSISFDNIKIVAIIIMLLMSGLMFLLTHILATIYSKIKEGLFTLSYFDLFTIAYILLLNYYLNKWFVLIVIIGIIYFYLVVYFKLHKTFERINYGTFIYLIGVVFICSLTISYVLFEVNEYNTNIEKNKYALYINQKGDALAEYLLNDAILKVKNDQYIKNKFLSPLANWEDVEQKIKRVYLGNYFDKFNIRVCIYNADGYQLNKKIGDFRLSEYDLKYAKNPFKTSYPSLYFVSKSIQSQQYVSILEIKRGKYELGYIVLDLKIKKNVPNNIFPELLVDEKFDFPKLDKKFSYAIYSHDTLIFTSGNFNYERNILKHHLKLLRSAELSKSIAEHSHLAIRQGKYKTMLISSPEYTSNNILSNFSFYFLLHCVFLLFLVAIVIVLNYWFPLPIKNTLSTRIQIYVNVAIFLPLFIISTISIALISNSHKQEVEKLFFEKAKRLTDNFGDIAENYAKNKFNKEEIYQLVAENSRLLQTDFIFYNKNGDWVASSQPVILETGLLSNKINPNVYIETVLNKSKFDIREEKIGNLVYSNIYFPLKSSKNGKIIGIISVPFFESEEEAEKLSIAIITTIFNIFTVLFLIFIFLSFIATRSLTIPLLLITEQLKNISLSARNKPIRWNSADEIGLLVNEYNSMLQKLEESKRILAETEKEQAWKEMAKQVAHEIKNPLTPMKLKLQFLERALIEKREGTDELLRNTISTLTEQIDTLSEIASSFSSFASMPDPIIEKHELNHIIQSTAQLYLNDERMEFSMEIPSEKMYAFVDDLLLGRILTNLILNAFQAVDTNKRPVIKLQTEIKTSNCLISVSDNGTGIPENIREKVFLPNFSTKFTGSGLGLAMAKKGIESFGGKIWFDTTEGHGTAFYIELPLIAE